MTGFEQRMSSLLGDELPSFLASLSEPPSRGLRVNPAKTDAAELSSLLGVELAPVPWSSGTGFLLPADAPSLGFHPAIDCGLFYLQDPASMLAPELMAPEPGWRVADVAAAPGGKTTDLAARVGPGGVVLANEVANTRLRLLETAVDRWGSPAVATSSATLGRLFGAWDGVLLDAPCTGEALVRRDPEAVRDWSDASVRGNARRQARLLDEVAPLVRQGGVLVYSTCSFESAENEEQVEAFLSRHSGWALDEERRVWPHRAPGDGQYVARLVRDGRAEPRRRSQAELRRAPSFVPAKKRAVAAWREFREAVLPGLVPEEDGIYIRGDALYLVPEPLRDVDLEAISRPGLPLGRLRPGRFEPAHALATAVQPAQAARRAQWTPAYLHGETVPDPGPDGWTLVVYERWGIGWARRSQGVLKNFFPKHLRRAS